MKSPHTPARHHTINVVHYVKKDIFAMMRFLILFLWIPATVVCQSKFDYDIYSLLINKRIVDWKMNKDTISNVIVVNSLTRFSLDSTMIEVIDEMTSNNSYTYSLLHFYDKPLDILNNSEFKILLNDFKTKLIQQTDLKADSFKLEIPIKIETKQRIEKLFDLKNAKGFDKAWRKYYKDYPTSPGYFEFSKVAFSDNFAVVYIVHRVRPLIGSGGLEILTNENGNWKRLAYYNIWNN